MVNHNAPSRGLPIKRRKLRIVIQIIAFAILLQATIGIAAALPQEPLPTIGETPPGASMPAPPGYSKLIFSDKFGGTTLNSNKWIPQIADKQWGIWGNNGKLAYPLSAVGNAGGYNAEYGNPSRVIVNDGLTLSAKRDTSQQGYTWVSGYICSYSKFTFRRGYVQIRARMPDSRTGGWGALWFMDGGGEIDLQESGFTALGANNANQVMAMNLHTSGNTQKFYNTGVDLSAGYHIYGMEYLPGQSLTFYFDGKQVGRYTSNIPTAAYTIIATMQIAQNAAQWHTVVSSQTPQPLTMKLSEVQVWNK